MITIKRLARMATVTVIAGTVGGAAVLAAQAMVARARPYAKPDMRLAMRSSVGAAGKPPMRLVLLGDATALGVGVDRVADTVGGQLAALLSEGTSEGAVGRRVELSSVAVAGSRSSDLATQVARALVGPAPDVTVILVGTNDVTHLGRGSDAAEYLGSACRRLRDAGIPVVVGTCPDFGALRAFAPPLRQLLGWRSRRVAKQQAAAASAAGAVVVDLAARTGAVFRADAGTLCHDGFHPSADGYRVWAHALLPAVEEAAAVRGFLH
ncbi:SGNH/GDSL hydrolase family protein [Dactylosporangium sp. NPDC006015]|uniref:SGNH/GDSL hydrolase family protein n=1 Tax=unclassified Dactylosporangium TaxID=2621675 RepID=UPI0033B6BF29